MIQKLILINSANFNFLEVDLQKDLFFLGDNGSGKTTVIRAIHYLFSGDVRNLGIPSDKEGFKEYYFRYQNSYIIYVFEDFFIFMYKAGGEIVKLFSKQKFDIGKIVDEKSDLYGFDEIKKYVKTPNLRKTVKSLNDYRDIIYGNNKQLLDFKFTSIRNSDTFIGLFNEIFNIDKSIIDAKSIKKAIQTTLEYEKRVIDFNHEEYLQKIYEFQSEYKFFKEFEKQKSTIDTAYNLKENLLSIEREIDELQSHMLYRAKFERGESDKTHVELAVLDEKLNKTKEMLKIKRNTLSRCETRFKTLSNSLELEIQRIAALKEKFSQDNILFNRDRADKYSDLENSLSELNQALIKLKSGFEDQLESINKEIKELQYKREKELLRERDDKRFNQKRSLLTILEENIQKIELDLETQKNSLEYGINEIKKEIVQLEEEISALVAALSSLDDEHKTAVKNLKNSYEKKEDTANKEINASLESIDTKKREIKRLGYDLEDLKRDNETETQLNNNHYDLEQSRLNTEIQKYQTMIFSKPNSFKEFLQDEVDGWEYELYPILDDTLLEMDRDELKPKLLREDMLFSIELQREGLKKILSKDEADAKIDALNLEKENLEQSYRESLEKIEQKYKKNQENIEEQTAFAAQEIAGLDKKIAQLKSEILSVKNELEDKLSEEKEHYVAEEKKRAKEIENLKTEIKHNHSAIDEINKNIKDFRIHANNDIKDLKDDFDDGLAVLDKELDLWLKGEQEKIDRQISLKEQEKHKITKDERLKQLEDEINGKKNEFSESIRAKAFLNEYENSKAEIETLLQKKSRQENIKLKNSEFTKRLEFKIDKYENSMDKLKKSKEELFKKENSFKKGLELFEPMHAEFEAVKAKESSEYLYQLVQRYNASLQEYKNKKIDLKDLLDKINTLKNTQNIIDIYFKFEEYNNHRFISQTPNILAKIDEIAVFKEKKLEIIKQSGHKKFINFVNNLLPQKMSIFSDSEDKFLSQVSKINKNLSGIDFGVIKDIRIDTNVGDKKSIAKLLSELHLNVANLSSLLNESSLFYDKDDILVELNRLEIKFKGIKSELKGDSISLQDTIDLSLSFNENGKQISQVSQLKNESSTGGSMLLKIAIAISILQLFIKEEKTPFFLIVDEVSRLHSDNQEKLREFANKKGFGIVFVTPEPTYSKPHAIKYYRFRKNADDEFEAVELNL